jgi:NAD(P)-dependent dehydrogenase (short-subunit alcohol dehydrogenase family)
VEGERVPQGAAASGMGRAGALRFAREDAQIAVIDVDAPDRLR